MVLNGAGLLAPRANNLVGAWRNFNLFWYQIVNALQSAAFQSVLVEVGKQRIKTLVSGKNKTLCLRRSLDGPSKLKGNVEVQGVLAAAFNLLEVNSAESVCRRWLLGGLGRILLGANENDRAVRFVQN